MSPILLVANFKISILTLFPRAEGKVFKRFSTFINYSKQMFLFNLPCFQVHRSHSRTSPFDSLHSPPTHSNGLKIPLSQIHRATTWLIGIRHVGNRNRKLSDIRNPSGIHCPGARGNDVLPLGVLERMAKGDGIEGQLIWPAPIDRGVEGSVTAVDITPTVREEIAAQI